MASGTSTTEATPDSKRRAAMAVQRLMGILESKLGDASVYGETVVKVIWKEGQIAHVQITGVDDLR